MRSCINITVYLGANEGIDRTLKESVIQLGARIGKSGNALIYGGPKSGLMGELAVSALSNGAKVIEVEPQFSVDECLQLDGLSELIITKMCLKERIR